MYIPNVDQFLEIKHRSKIQWQDLEYIERPDYAVRNFQKAYYSHFYQIKGLVALRGHTPVLAEPPAGPLADINKKLEDGEYFLINKLTAAPAIVQLEITKDHTAEWELSPWVKNHAKLFLEHILMTVAIPNVYTPIRDEPQNEQTQSQQPQKPKAQIERHMVQLEVSAKNGRPLPEKRFAKIVVVNTSQSTVPVEQRRNVIYTPESRVFKANSGDSFKIYAVSERMVDVHDDLNDNHNLDNSEAAGLISPLEITGTDTRYDDVIVHHAKYEIANNYLEIELLDDDDIPQAGEAYQVLDPEGSIMSEGKLDDNGYALVEGIEVEDINVHFPSNDADRIAAEE